jgi:hypothetical protein
MLTRLEYQTKVSDCRLLNSYRNRVSTAEFSLQEGIERCGV